MFPVFDPQAMRTAVERHVSALLDRMVVPLLVGGDHSIALPSLRAVRDHYGPVAVVHVDAHFDTSGPEVWGDAFHHGTSLRHALDEGLIADGQLHRVGMRGPWSSPDDRKPSLAHRAQLHDADAIAEKGALAVAAAVRSAVGDTPVYLTLDIDAVDPAFAPGTGTPVPGGLDSRQILAFIRGLAGIRVVGMDLVEVCPALDHADITCHLAVNLLFETLALVVLARRLRREHGQPSSDRRKETHEEPRSP